MDLGRIERVVAQPAACDQFAAPLESLAISVPIHSRDDLQIPEMIFMIPRMLLVFDHRFRKLQLICNAHVTNKTAADQAYGEAEAKLKADVKAARERIVIEAESLARLAAERILGRAI